MKARAHRHRARTTSTVGYRYPIPGAVYNAKAHGGVMHIDRCSCGAERLTNSTGPGREERGPWRMPAGDA